MPKIWSTQSLADRLEPIVDEHGIAAVLEALALVASEKADHIESNWQDSDLAKRWNVTAAAILNSWVKARLNVGYGE